jgi:DNA-binding NarL/FixJ family response regulator
VALVNANSHEAAEERARLQAAGAERERLLVEVQGLLAKGLVDLTAELDQAERYAPATVTGHLRRARVEAENTMAAVRLSLGAAGHSPLEDRTLEDALRAELGWAQRARGADVRLVVAGAPVPLDRALAEHVLSVAQEAVSNIVRHSGASTIRLGLVYNSAALALLVQDDGQGFVPDTDDQRAGLGLRRMVELTSSVGGSATVESVPGWGTSVRAWFPYQRTAGTDQERIDVLVVAAHPLMRAGISRLLAWSGPTLAVVGEAAGGADALTATTSVRPAVVVVGPDLGQAELIRQVITTASEGGGPGVAVVAMWSDQHAVADALLAGAHCCVETTADGKTLARAVVAASRGESLVSDSGVWAGRLTSDPNPAGLTARELEVYALISEGLPDKMIANRLGIAVKTVEKHVGAVLRKTGSRGRAELIARGLPLG